MSKIASTSGNGSVTSSVSSTLTLFKEYELVRVRQLIQSVDALDGWGVNQRPPAVGDVGTLLDILTAPGVPRKYVVECSGKDGVSIWLADFFEDEIEPA